MCVDCAGMIVVKTGMGEKSNKKMIMMIKVVTDDLFNYSCCYHYVHHHQ